MDNNAVVQCVDIFFNNIFLYKGNQVVKISANFFYDILNARSTLQR